MVLVCLEVGRGGRSVVGGPAANVGAEEVVHPGAGQHGHHLPGETPALGGAAASEGGIDPARCVSVKAGLDIEMSHRQRHVVQASKCLKMLSREYRIQIQHQKYHFVDPHFPSQAKN